MQYMVLNNSEDTITFYDSLGNAKTLRKGMSIISDKLPEARSGLVAYKLDKDGKTTNLVNISLENALELKKQLEEQNKILKEKEMIRVKQLKDEIELKKKELEETNKVLREQSKLDLKKIEEQKSVDEKNLKNEQIKSDKQHEKKLADKVVLNVVKKNS